MTEKIKFLREETVSGRNKRARRPIPSFSTADEQGGIPIRRALALKKIFDEMPLFIGEEELIVGTRTYLRPHESNTDGHSSFDYTLDAFPKYVRAEDIDRFGGDYSAVNKRHYTPDLGILLKKGVGGIIRDAEERKGDPTLAPHSVEFLDSLIISYRGLESLINRYAAYAAELASAASDNAERTRLSDIARVCKSIATEPPKSFREAIQLLWLGHLSTIIESFYFICYGRLDVILAPYLGDTPREEALELIECLLLKMYDQADVNDKTYIKKHEGQLTVTLGGVLPNGESAVSDVTMLFLDAIDEIRLPDPEFNLRISSANPPEFLDKAARLTVSGANFVSYYNDDLFVDSLTRAGLEPSVARSYAFDLCQDITVPGAASMWCICDMSLTRALMELLCDRTDFESFEQLLAAYKDKLAARIDGTVSGSNREGEIMTLYRDGRFDEYFAAIKQCPTAARWDGRSPMCPLPYLSGLYHGAIENACDMIYECYPYKDRGAMVGTATEAVNSLAAIKRTVFLDRAYTLAEIVEACKSDYAGADGELIRQRLLSAPKWGNDDPFVDSIAKEIIEFCLLKFTKCTTFSGGRVLSGIHQPHPVSTGKRLMATPDGRRQGAPVAVTMTPASGTMKHGPTAALRSASVFDRTLLQWNYCVMVNYYKSVFYGNSGADIFKRLLLGYFGSGGMQHQPNVMDADELRRAQTEPEKYKDLIVRLWGVSAHFVDLPRELQDEMIARLG